MFKNIYPLFESKRLLKKEMLENLRDYPRNLFLMQYQNYSDGILAGCNLVVRGEMLLIEPGIVYYKKVPYILEEEWKMTYEFTGKMMYLKVMFPDKISGVGQNEYLSRIYLDEKIPDNQYEIELARFKLQPGSRLRSEYTDFYDYSTEFDTINKIDAPYASPAKSSIYTPILKSFAKTLMRCQIQNPWDYSFCMNCLQTYDVMSYETIKAYLNVRLKLDKKEYSNAEIYEKLKGILLEAEGKKHTGNQIEKSERKMVLL